MIVIRKHIAAENCNKRNIMARMVYVYIRYIYDICFPMLKQKAGLQTNEN